MYWVAVLHTKICTRLALCCAVLLYRFVPVDFPQISGSLHWHRSYHHDNRGYFHECLQSSDSPTLLWRHNDRGGVSDHQPYDCLLSRLFKRRSKKTSKIRVTGLCVGNSPGTGEFPAQMASNAENASIWWRHHENSCCWEILIIISHGMHIISCLITSPECPKTGVRTPFLSPYEQICINTSNNY